MRGGADQLAQGGQTLRLGKLLLEQLDLLLQIAGFRPGRSLHGLLPYSASDSPELAGLPVTGFLAAFPGSLVLTHMGQEVSPVSGIVNSAGQLKRKPI